MAAASSSAAAPGSVCFYYATSQPPTAVTHARVGAFTAPPPPAFGASEGEGAGALDLILAKTSRIEVFRLAGAAPAGEMAVDAAAAAAATLEPVYATSINGRIGTMNLARVGVSSCRAVTRSDAPRRCRSGAAAR
jgi:hypothetical protein